MTVRPETPGAKLRNFARFYLFIYLIPIRIDLFLSVTWKIEELSGSSVQPYLCEHLFIIKINLFFYLIVINIGEYVKTKQKN